MSRTDGSSHLGYAGSSDFVEPSEESRVLVTLVIGRRNVLLHEGLRGADLGRTSGEQDASRGDQTSGHRLTVVGGRDVRDERVAVLVDGDLTACAKISIWDFKKRE